MKTSTFLLTIAFFLTYLPLHTNAQDNEITQTDWQEWTRGSRIVKTTGPNEEIEGSPYFNSEWTQGWVDLRSQGKTDNVPLRYNAYSNELEFKKDGKILVIIPRFVNAFKIKNEDNQEVLFEKGFKSPEHDIHPGLFLRMVHDGKVKLLAKHKTNFQKAHSVDPLTGKKTSRFIPKKDYYLITENGSFHDIKLKRKHLLRALANHQNELKKYAQKNDLDFGEEQDLARILSHYESLDS